MERLSRRLTDFLYPPRAACWLCSREGDIGEDYLCADCSAALRPCPSPAFHAPLDGLTVGLQYNDEARELVQRLKYSDQPHLARVLAYYMELPEQWRADALAPVPLHPIKLLMRGFNQSRILAGELHEKYPSVPVREDLLRRVRFTPSQAGLSRDKRVKNLKGAFAASDRVRGMNIVLVDDVATTRSTLVSCALALKQKGAARVYAVCACSPELPENG